MKDTRPFPVDGSTQSYWQHEGQKNGLSEKLKQNNIDFPDICDVAIVGGGYAGIATAYHLLKSTSPPPRVVLLEGREPCSGATGRNGGHLRPDYFMAAAKSSERYGAAAAFEVVQFEVNHLSAIKSLIESEGIVCDFNETVSLCVFTKPEIGSLKQGLNPRVSRPLQASKYHSLPDCFSPYSGRFNSSTEPSGVVRAFGGLIYTVACSSALG